MRHNRKPSPRAVCPLNAETSAVPDSYTMPKKTDAPGSSGASAPLLKVYKEAVCGQFHAIRISVPGSLPSGRLPDPVFWILPPRKLILLFGRPGSPYSIFCFHFISSRIRRQPPKKISEDNPVSRQSLPGSLPWLQSPWPEYPPEPAHSGQTQRRNPRFRRSWSADPWSIRRSPAWEHPPR